MKQGVLLTRGQKAVLVSCVLHGLLLVVLGVVFPVMQSPQDSPETCLELEVELEDEAGGVGPALAQPVEAGGGEVSPAASVAPSLRQPHRNHRTAFSAERTMATEAAASLDSGAGGTGEADGNSAGAFGGTGGTGSGQSGGGSGNGGGGGGNGSGQGGGSAAQGGIIPPSIVTQPKPVYPAAAKQAGREGRVTLKVQILTSGLPGDVILVTSSGYSDLDEAAMAAVRKWVFTPARERDSGKAVVRYIRRDVVFDLHD